MRLSISGLPTSTTAISNDQGIVTAELMPGEYQISDVNAADFVLFKTFEITDTDLEVSLPYSISTKVTGVMNAYTTELMKVGHSKISMTTQRLHQES